MLILKMYLPIFLFQSHSMRSNSNIAGRTGAWGGKNGDSVIVIAITHGQRSWPWRRGKRGFPNVWRNVNSYTDMENIYRKHTKFYFFFLFLLPYFFRHCITFMFDLYYSHLLSALVIISVYVYTVDIESTALIFQNNVL